jgi:hypothetical protein
MNEHAILITAYTDFPYLMDLIDSFQGNFDIYIHIDKKSHVSPSFLQGLCRERNVKAVDSVYSIYWGGRNHVSAILWLCKEALEKSPCATHFHLISGNDMLIKAPKDVIRYFHSAGDANFLDFFPLPSEQWAGGGLNRLEYIHPMDRLNVKERYEAEVYARYLRMQRQWNFRRPLPEYPLYGGSSWWSLTRRAVEYMISHYNWNGWYSRLENTFAPDEMYVQTLLLNSELAGTIVPNHLRYILWEPQNGSLPAILDERNLSRMIQSDAVFARKVNRTISHRLIAFYRSRIG